MFRNIKINYIIKWIRSFVVLKSDKWKLCMQMKIVYVVYVILKVADDHTA